MPPLAACLLSSPASLLHESSFIYLMARPEVFFLPTAAGSRFCLYYPSAQGRTRGAILYVHPFIEEMNKARRMAAEQSRQLCAAGWNVLQMDLAGCGDSEGDFGDATWALWLADIDAAWSWLQQRSPGEPHWLWGTRLGGLLAAAFISGLTANRFHEVSGVLYWQPVLSGMQQVTQFLRLRTVQAQLDQSGGENLQSLRDSLNAGQSLEIAGYRLAPGLALPMQAADLAKMDPLPPRVIWLEVSAQPNAAAAPASQRLIDLWQQRGVDLSFYPVQGPAFWQTQEIEMCPTLLAMTVLALEQKTMSNQEAVCDSQD